MLYRIAMVINSIVDIILSQICPVVYIYNILICLTIVYIPRIFNIKSVHFGQTSRCLVTVNPGGAAEDSWQV